MDTPGDSRLRYRPELDWLRFVAFSGVFLFHALPKDAGAWRAAGLPAWAAGFVAVPLAQVGGYGVDLFFVLSAYLLGTLLFAERERLGTVDVPAFYMRRILRIWPLFFAYVIGAAAYEVPFTGASVLHHLGFLLFVGNWTNGVLALAPAYFCNHLWSICVEEQFYLAWPHLVKRLRPVRLAAALVAVLAAATAYRAWYVHHAAPNDFVVWVHTPTRIDGFALGGLLAWSLRGRSVPLPPAARRGLAAAAAGGFYFLGLQPFGGYFGTSPAWSYPLAGLSATALVAAVATSPPRPGPLGATGRAFAFLGRISFGLYVFHVLGLALAGHVLPHGGAASGAARAARMALGAGITAALAVASWFVLERPFLRLKARYTHVESRPL